MGTAYKIQLSLVADVINQHDPIALLKQGAPNDEYSDEVQRIVAGLHKCASVDDAQQLIYSVFKENFGQHTAGNVERYQRIAEELFQRLHQSKVIGS